MTIPRRVLSFALCALAAAPAAAQTNEELINEVIRRAHAGEDEGGFCQVVRWPTYWTPLQAARVYDADYPGSIRASVHRYKNQGCGVARTTGITYRNGRRCVVQTGWHCFFGKNCVYYPSYTLCKDDEGAYIYQD